MYEVETVTQLHPTTPVLIIFLSQHIHSAYWDACLVLVVKLIAMKTFICTKHDLMNDIFHSVCSNTLYW